jgi:hypothetical protein
MHGLDWIIFGTWVPSIVNYSPFLTALVILLEQYTCPMDPIYGIL